METFASRCKTMLSEKSADKRTSAEEIKVELRKTAAANRK
jgi:hypothetical protein